MICLDIEEKDEIVPFLYSLPSQFKHFKGFFIRLGATEKAHPMVYGNILKKMAFVCGQDYLNSNELCKALKAEEEFFRLLRIAVNSEESETKNKKSENTTAKAKLTGLYFVSTELKLEKSGLLTILDNSEQLNYVLKLPNEKYLFNPSEKLFKTKTLEIKPLLNAIHVAQRPTLFSFKYEENYDFSLPEDFASQSHSICASLIASSAPQMNNLLHLANVSNEANILTVIKQQYVPMPGGIYADDISLLSQYNMEVHEVIVGDLCVYFKPDGNYIYCKIIMFQSILNVYKSLAKNAEGRA